MAVYQPSGIIGNSHTLVTIGDHGELMSFFYPHIDFSQNLHQGMPALYIGEPGAGHLEWTFEANWRCEQHYLVRSPVLRTTCVHRRLAVELEFTDFVLPHSDVMVRCVELRNGGPTPFHGIFYQYLDLQLGEVQPRNGLRWIAERGEYSQYWRNYSFAVGGDAFDQHGGGKSGAGNSAKLGMSWGRLNFNNQEIGNVDLTVGWEVRLKAGESTSRLLLISAANNEQAALQQLDQARDQGYPALLQETTDDAQAYLAQARSVRVPDDLAGGYWLGLLVLRMLFDNSYGACLAAPEFDPTFEQSGGYGYCWPRDAAEVVLALEAVGQRELGMRFLEWARVIQNEDGSWEQRYWINGERGPAWCTLVGHAQLDQVGSVLLAMERLITTFPAADQPVILERFWPAVKRGAAFLLTQIDPKLGLHKPGCDLWETFYGSFPYTNAAIWAGLHAAAALARPMGCADCADEWQEQANLIKRSLLQKLWMGASFARAIDLSGEVDPGIDSSVLGLIDPFALLDLEDDCEREMAETSVETVRRYLPFDINGKKAIARFEGDQYLGGSAGGVNTLWMARVLLRLALHYQGKDPARARDYGNRALEYIRLVKSRATAAGLLPELIGGPVASYWAAPHGWATASYIVCMLLLDRLAGDGVG